MFSLLAIAPDVAEALANGAPVVALESTVIAHGLPAPHNLDVARAMQAAVRKAGAVPAMTAVIAGRVRIGLDDATIAHLAQGTGILKVSRRDLAYALSAGVDGATTVSATMICAARAGIAVMATGGIGGVHRGVEATLDISADLEELARTDVTVVCAGAKTILDLPRTLEYLETRGVPIVGYRCDEFPAFFTRSSGQPVSCRLDTPQAVAGIIAAQRALGLGSGMVIAREPPAALALDAAAAEAAIAKAIAAAEASGIRGKALTPFLLDEVAKATGGDSVRANKALLEANAALAAEIAVALAATPHARQPAAPG
jgi:pseudouridine-5'-phosphate glycosidase